MKGRGHMPSLYWIPDSPHEFTEVNNILHKRAKPIRFIINNNCWECISHVLDRGYPRIRYQNRLWIMSRLVYEIYNNKKITEGLHILHSCDNPMCINPKHLREGTDRDNMDDMLERNRRPLLQGEDTSSAKLTEEQVAFIRKDGAYTMKQLANMFDISLSCIKSIKLGRAWGWLEGEINTDMVRAYKKVSTEDRKNIVIDSSTITREQLAEKYNTSVANIYKILREER